MITKEETNFIMISYW